MNDGSHHRDATPRRTADAGSSPVNERWYGFCKRILQLGWVTLYRVRVSGRENIPAEGPVLLASNHQSHFDPPLIGACCPRRANYMARRTLFPFAPFAWLLNSLGAFPIDRDGVGLAGVKETLRRLRRGEPVLVFPEGTRTYDGRIAPFRPGLAALAARSRAAIVPVGVAGAYDAWPRWRPLPGPGRLVVHFGPAIAPDEVRALDDRALVAEVERRVRAAHAVAQRAWAHRAAHPADAGPLIRLLCQRLRAAV
ncbi:MAG: 1-acyl-sn-glycerol-3-phosphate acyltransferase [Pirellulales bacterium]|nr:1-acyl-sn-glycerol-3-phosphate acyltransferase [Pirellulales bacterium]